MDRDELLDEIRRVFGNRMFEAHPLRCGSAGMEGFAVLTPAIRTLCAEDLSEFVLPRLEALLSKVKCCRSCACKLCAFAEIMLEAGLPEKATAFGERYADHFDRPDFFAMRSGRGSVRDFRAEVREELEKRAGMVV